MNISARRKKDLEGLAGLFQVLAQPARLQILFGIGQGEVCVCHLEAMLKQRQAYISQEMMLFKNAGLVLSRRSGRNIYYRLKDPELLGQISGFAKQYHHQVPESCQESIPGCTCPECNPGEKDCLPES